MHLLDLLVARRGAKATDPRDLVYAVLGMHDDARRFFSADYGLDTEQVYVLAAMSVVMEMQARRNVWWPTLRNVLAAAERGRLARSMPRDLPSWVPDWTMAGDIAPLPPTFLGGTAESRFDPDETRLGEDRRPWCTTAGNPPILVCLGHRLSMTVEHIGPFFPPIEALSPKMRTLFLQVLQAYSRFANYERPTLLTKVLIGLFSEIAKHQGPGGGTESAGQRATTLDTWLSQSSAMDNPLVHMIRAYLDGSEAPHRLQGRRLALLKQTWMSGSATTFRSVLSVVPYNAQPDDLCVALLPSVSLYLVREEDNPTLASEQQVLQGAQQIKACERTWANGWETVKPTAVGTWARLVGECFPTTFHLPGLRPEEEIKKLPLFSNHVVAIL
jgi:hypothetical protein